MNQSMEQSVNQSFIQKEIDQLIDRRNKAPTDEDRMVLQAMIEVSRKKGQRCRRNGAGDFRRASSRRKLAPIPDFLLCFCRLRLAAIAPACDTVLMQSRRAKRRLRACQSRCQRLPQILSRSRMFTSLGSVP